MSRQLLCVILLLQFHACFSSRGLVAFHDKLHHNLHKEEYLGSKEEKANSQMMQGCLTTKCRMKMEHCTEEREGIYSKLETQKKKRMVKETTMIFEARATLESSSQKYNESKKSNEATKSNDVDFKDYAQPTRKPPIHNTKS